MEIPEEDRGAHRGLLANDADKTEITHLVSRLPEMPEEMELNRHDREKLAETMLEYTPGSRNQEQSSQGGDQRGQERKYTCLNCNRTFTTPIGRPVTSRKG